MLCPVPNLQGDVDWSVEGPALRDRIVEALDRSMLPGLKETITEDFYMTPEDFRDDYLSVHGAGFSVAPIFRQSAWFRFHNRAEGVENLYLVGAGTHPGAGMPGVLCSAKVVDRLVAEAEVHDLAEEELAAADAVLKAHGRTFHWARRFLGQQHAVRATLLYSFCHFVDDAADEASSEEEARATLAAIREDLERERPTLRRSAVRGPSLARIRSGSGRRSTCSRAWRATSTRWHSPPWRT